MAAPIRKGEESRFASTRSRTAGTAWAGSTGSSSSSAAAARRSRAGARDEGEARLRRGDPDSGSRAWPRSGGRAVPPLRRLRRLPLPGSRLRAPGRGEGSAGARRPRAPGRLRRAARGRDRPRALRVRIPEQARVLVRGRRERRRPGSRLPSRRSLGRGDRRRGMPADDRPRQRDPRGCQDVGARRGARALRPGRVRPGTSAISSCARGATRIRCSCCSSPRPASTSTPTSSSRR